jgi:hypothetical protein
MVAPAQVRIGVTGHRSFLHLPDVVTALESVLERVLLAGVEATVVSSLAEGADRLVADVVLTRSGARLEAVLPLPADQYRDDFETNDGREDFERLLRRASVVDVVDAGDGSREDAYERAGREVVERSDILIALWDGEPARGRAGCAEIVQYALDREKIVEVVLVERDRIVP